MKRSLLLSAFFVFLSFWALSQQIQIMGTVKSETDNLPLPGATVLVKGTSVGVVTDVDGKYAINANPNQVLVFSYIGMSPQEIKVTTGSKTIDVVLKSSSANISEVVVVGYGTQKKSVVTGSISSVKARDIENIPTGRVEQALQGRVSGVTIAMNSGQPGSTSTIRVRGITTFGGGNNPLWVIDGVVVDAGGIGYLNQSDIESIEVLKDATSAAIYGTRAATGVILITTKKGKSGKMRVSYDGFYGTSAPAKVLTLLNASQYAAILNERSVGGGGNIMFPSVNLGTGTDWQKEIFNYNAGRYSHELSLSGGNDVSTFYASFGRTDQTGIVASDISKFTRTSLRLNSTHKISKVFTFGQTLGYTHAKGVGLGNTNSEYGGPLSSAINLDPITPVVITDPVLANSSLYTGNPVFRDANGNPYGISTVPVGQEMTNPLAYIQTRLGNYNWSDDMVGNAYLEATITKNIKVRSSLGGKLAFWGDQNFTPVYYLSPAVSSNKNSFGKSNNNTLNWNVENTITYSNKIGKHDFSVLLGQGAYVDNNGGGSSVYLFDLPITSYKDASFNFDISQANRVSGSSDLTLHKLSSLFGRLNYNYDEKYLFTGIIRRDGSSRFGLNNKYGVFPSFSLGWVVSREDFWKSNDIVNTLKIRGGYGVVGNDAISDFGYLSTVAGGFNYTVGNAGAITTGYSPTTLDNPNLRWEETSQINVGFDATLLHNFTMTVDVYKKKTTGILRPINIPGYVGVSSNPVGNVADMENTGVELEVGYRKQIGEVNLSANGNIAYVKNKVTYVASDANFISGDASFQSMGAVTRTQVGQSYNSFYGYQTDGIFQNWTEVNAYVNSKGGLLQPTAKPGDFRWANTNGDSIISGDDKTFLGTNLPKLTFGLTLTAACKGFDVMVFGTGAAGNKIFQGLRRLDIANSNYSSIALSRWTGEGTSNSYPRLSSDDPNGNFSNMSDFYLEKGDYLRLKVAQIGYTLNNKMLTQIGVSKLRIYVTAENLLTLTNYTGYDPEVGGGVFGIDKGQYPQARAFIIGGQIQF
jgi:TonB-dependent starch-binding outer membrane protein SusC